MPKIIIQIGLDQKLFQEIEAKRGAISRTSFISDKLRSAMSASVPQQTDTTASPTGDNRGASND